MDYTKMNDKPGKTFGLKNSDYCPDGVSWLCKKKIMVNDYILQEYNNKHYIDVNLDLITFDFINNMKISSKKNNFTYNYHINGCFYPHTVYFRCLYLSLSVRVLFDELPSIDDEITFSAKSHYLVKKRKDFLDSNMLSFGNFERDRNFYYEK
jgi:hypothetical protein